MGCGSGMVGPKIEEETGKRKVLCVKFQRECPGSMSPPSIITRSANASTRMSPRKPGRCGSSR